MCGDLASPGASLWSVSVLGSVGGCAWRGLQHFGLGVVVDVCGCCVVLGALSSGTMAWGRGEVVVGSWEVGFFVSW